MRTFILCFVLSLFFINAQGQDIDLGKVSVGAFLGANVSTYAIQSEQAESNARFGYQFGGYIRYGERFFLHSGLSWYRVSTRLMLSTPLSARQGRVDVNLIQLPLMAGLKVWKQEKKGRTFRIQAGPAVSVLAGVNENDLALSGDDFSNIWLGALVGLGVDVWIFTLDAGYQWGLNDAFSGDAVGANYRMGTLSLGLRF